MNQEILSGRVARYGLPAAILIFYITAAAGFPYTPESTYTLICPTSAVDPGGSASPLWQLLLAAGGAFRLDPLLSSKVLSLVLSSFTLLAVYLLGVEVLGDRILALCAALMCALQSWLLQLAVTGHPLSLALILSVAGMFFLVRNDYMPGAFVLALAVLVFWQAVVLLFVLIGDAVTNSRDRTRGARLAAASAAVGAGVLILWIVMAATRGEAIVPLLPDAGWSPRLSAAGIAGLAVTGGLALAGIVALLGNRSGGREMALALLPIVLATLWLFTAPGARRAEFWHIGVPLLLILALTGLRTLMELWQRGALVYGAALALTGLVVMQNQIDFAAVVKPAMAGSSAETEELVSIAFWLRAHADPDEDLAAEHAPVLAYYMDRPVRAFDRKTDAAVRTVVSSAPVLSGFTAVYRPSIRFSVFRRNAP